MVDYSQDFLLCKAGNVLKLTTRDVRHGDVNIEVECGFNAYFLRFYNG